MANKPKRILAIRLSAMGDVAIIVPAIDAMRQQYPDTELYILTNSAFTPFFEKLEGVSVIGIKIKDYKGLKGLYSLYKELKAYDFDLIADLHNVIRSKIIRTFFRLSGVAVKVIDKGRKGKHALTRKKNKKLIQLETSAERYADVFRKAGFALILSFKTIYANNIVLNDVLQNITPNKSVAKIGIAPFAKHTGKIYPIERMEQVVQRLDEKGIAIYLFGGGSDEKAILDKWAAKYQNCTSVVGMLNLTDELQLISCLNVMLTMDSGNMHLASLVNTPVVSVWGATHPYAGFYGWGQKNEDIVQAELLCRPCSVYGNKPCYRHDYACMMMIEPDVIIEKLNRYI